MRIPDADTITFDIPDADAMGGDVWKAKDGSFSISVGPLRDAGPGGRAPQIQSALGTKPVGDNPKKSNATDMGHALLDTTETHAWLIAFAPDDRHYRQVRMRFASPLTKDVAKTIVINGAKGGPTTLAAALKQGDGGNGG